MKKQRFSSKLLAFLMAILILAVSLPTYAFATLIDTQDDVNAEEQVSSATEEITFPKSEVYVLEEDTALRTENTKHFKLSDGTVKAVSYAQPVHYMDENGKWIDIDNALTLNGNEYSVKNKQEIKFANKSGSTGLISIKDGEYKIDFTPLNTNKVSVEIENPQENSSRKFDDVKKLNNLVSYATYKNIYDGIDLEYVLVGNNIKENIIVNEKQESYEFSFEIKLSKLNAELINNAVVLTDSTTGEQVYEIPAPYMLDASGEYSGDVEYTLTQNGKWKYTLTVTASTEWINDKERQLPVTIDPTLVVNSNITDISVVYEYEKSNNTITNTMVYVEDNASLIVGNFLNYYYDSVSFMKFNSLPEIPAGGNLITANLAFYVYNNLKISNGMDIGIYSATSDWSALTDKTYSGEYSAYNVYCNNSLLSSTITINDNGAYECDITDIYSNWISTPNANFGICFKGTNLPLNDNNYSTDDDMAIYIASSNGGIYYVTPQLEVTYVHMIGVEDYYAYAENTLGDVGKSYVNLYNGSLTYINRLTSIEIGENLTYDINMVYNSVEKKWQPSFAERIIFFDDDGSKLYGEDEANNDIGIERYLWRDPDGTYHEFTPYLEKTVFGSYVQYEESSVGDLWAVSDPVTFYPEDDIDYVLIQTENDEFILRDYQGNQKFFDREGKLTKICNSLGDMLYFYYIKQSNNESQIPRLSSIAYKSVNGTLTEQIRFEYTASFYNKLCYIYNIQSQDEINISWSTTKKIDSISYNIENHASTENINFNYSTNGFLKTATDSVTQEKLDFSMYTSGKHVGISTFLNNIKIKEYTIQYNTSNTTVIDCGTNLESENDNFIYVIYQFDAKGRKLTATFGNEATNYTYDDSILPDNLYYSVIYHQNIFKEPFNSTDDAATYFAKKYYYSSYYIRHEYGATIYSVNHNNTQTYNFTNIIYGSVHEVIVYFNMTVGGDVEGNIHTHPFDSSYSDDDKNGSVGNGYLVIPDLSIKKFNYESQEEHESTISFSPNELTNTEKSLLRERFEDSWQVHVASDCTAESDCDNHADEWPREISLP